MEYNLVRNDLYIVSFSPVKNKLYVLVMMFLLWVYVLYYCVGYCSTVPNLTVDSHRLRKADGKREEVAGGNLMSKLLSKLESRMDSEADHSQAPATTIFRDLPNGDNETDNWEEPRGEQLSPEHGVTSNSSNDWVSRLPQAIIIGVKKGGTRALLEFLRLHPEIKAVGAEPHFFDRNYDKGLDWYREMMPKSLEGQVTMEKTPSYFVTREAPARVHAMSRHTKLIVVVRDPVTRAVSDYAQTLSKRPAMPAFQSLVFRNGSGAPVDPSWSAVRIGLYAEHLEAWLRYFPLAQMLFVSGEGLIRDPAAEVARVQDFLGVKREVGERNFRFDRTKGFPCLVKGEGGRPHCLGKTKGRTHPKIPPRTLQTLRQFYEPHNRKFYQMTGHDFGWD